MEVFQSDLGFIEGPVITRDGAVVVTSIDRGLLYRIADGRARVLAELGGGPNGATEGPDGVIYVAQNGGQWPAENRVPAAPGIQAVAPDGTVRVVTGVATSPNDLAFGPDGRLYFTDPTRKPERDDGRIYACDIETGEVELLLTCDWYPNGIGFSAEDDKLYVADSRHSRIVRFPLDAVRPERMEVCCQMTRGLPDGFAFDRAGRLVIACPGLGGAPGNLQVWTPGGALVEEIDLGTSPFYTNLAISAAGEIYVCDSSAGRLLAGRWPSPGLALHPFRG